MSEVLLARWQFGITSTYHFLFVPLTLGLSVLLAWMEWQWVRTGRSEYKRMTQFWGNIFKHSFRICFGNISKLEYFMWHPFGGCFRFGDVLPLSRCLWRSSQQHHLRPSREKPILYQR